MHLKGNFGKFIVTAFPLFFVWFFNGFWHGSTWKFILYGLYYYLIMMLGILLQPYTEILKQKLRIHADGTIWGLFCVLRTILIVFIGMMIFRSHSMGTAWDMLVSMFTQTDTNILSHQLSMADFMVLIMGTCLMFCVSWLQEKEYNLYILLDKKHNLIRYGVIFSAIMIIVIFGIYGEGYNASDFIYGEF